MKSIIHATIAVLVAVACAHKQTSQAASESSTSETHTKPQVLFLLSGSNSVTTLEGNRHTTGYFLSELAGPAIALERAGFDLVIATPGGRVPAMDPVSNDLKWFKTPEALGEALEFVGRQVGLQTPKAIEAITESELARFLGIVVPGGHAPIEDLANNSDVGRILSHFHIQNKTTALICHGPAALLSAKTSKGWIYDGYDMTGFSTTEEKQEEDAGHLDGHMPYYLDAQLRAAGGNISVGLPWTSHVIQDRELITGQNPMSEEAFTAALLERLTKARFGSVTPFVVADAEAISQNQFYSIDEQAFQVIDWNSGYRTVWIGYRAERTNFWSHLKRHIDLTANTFRAVGLKGYLVYGNADYEIAYMHWDSKETADKAFASAAGQAVVQDASSFMKSLLFKEISENPFLTSKAVSLRMTCQLQTVEGTANDGRFFHEQWIEVTGDVVNLETIATDGDTHWTRSASLEGRTLTVQFDMDTSGQSATAIYQCSGIQ